MNTIINATYLISGIYTNFCTFICKKCDVGYYAINRGVYFTEEDHVVIKFLHQNKGQAQAFGKRISVENWKIVGLNKLLKKIDDIVSIARLPGILCLPFEQVMKLMNTGSVYNFNFIITQHY